MDPLLETLEGAVQRLRQPPSVAAEVEKIREQLAEHRAQGLELDKLLPSFSALCARGEELIGRAAHDDPAAQGETSSTQLSVREEEAGPTNQRPAPSHMIIITLTCLHRMNRCVYLLS